MVLATAEIPSTNSQAMGTLAVLLQQAPSATLQEFANLINTRLGQLESDTENNSEAIGEVIDLLSHLPNLSPAQLQQVIAEINNRLPDIPELIRIYHPDGTELTTTGAIESLILAATKAVVAVIEVQKNAAGQVTQATVEMADGSMRQVNFVRTVADGVSTYVGNLSDGAGGIAPGWEFKYGIQQITFAGQALSAWDGDLLAARTYVTGFAWELQTRATTAAAILAGDYPSTYPFSSDLVGSPFPLQLAPGAYVINIPYTQSIPDQVVRLLVNGQVLATHASAAVGSGIWSVGIEVLQAATEVTMEVADATTTTVSTPNYQQLFTEDPHQVPDSL